MLPSVTDVLGQRLDGVAFEPVQALAGVGQLDQLERTSTRYRRRSALGDFVLNKSSAEERFSASMACVGPLLTIYIKLWQQVCNCCQIVSFRASQCCKPAYNRGAEPRPNMASFIPSC